MVINLLHKNKQEFQENLNTASLLEVLCKKGDLRNFAEIIGKHLSQSLFFNEVQA